jgi:hypothetical protein
MAEHLASNQGVASSNPARRSFDLVAQWEEQWTSNPQVAGSRPAKVSGENEFFRELHLANQMVRAFLCAALIFDQRLNLSRAGSQ